MVPLNDTHSEKAPSNKKMKMDVWLVGTSNQVFKRGS